MEVEEKKEEKTFAAKIPKRLAKALYGKGARENGKGGMSEERLGNLVEAYEEIRADLVAYIQTVLDAGLELPKHPERAQWASMTKTEKREAMTDLYSRAHPVLRSWSAAQKLSGNFARLLKLVKGKDVTSWDLLRPVTESHPGYARLRQLHSWLGRRNGDGDVKPDRRLQSRGAP